MASMSPSPPTGRRSFSVDRASSHSSAKHEEDLIYAYEAEQERIMNVLSRKLEQLRNEKVDLENALEAENESHVLRLQAELAALRAQQLAANNGIASESEPVSPTAPRPAASSSLHAAHQADAPERDRDNATPGPSVQAMLDALRRENDGLRARLHDTERDYIRVTRLNDAYREELLDLRRRLSIPVDSLLAPSASPALHPNQSPPLSPVFGFSPLSPRSRTGSLSLPRPRSPHQHYAPHAAHHHHPSTGGTHGPPPSSFPPTFTDSPSPSSTPSTSVLTLSPMSSLLSSSLPPSSSRLTPSSSPAFQIPPPSSTPAWGGLTYPSVPPPSLSSSVGSVGSARGGMMPGPSTERGRGQGRRVVETGSLRRGRSSASPGAVAGTSANGSTTYGLNGTAGPSTSTPTSSDGQ